MTEQDIRRVAAEAMCDPRTVKAYAEGRRVYALTRERIESAIKKLKLKK